MGNPIRYLRTFIFIFTIFAVLLLIVSFQNRVLVRGQNTSSNGGSLLLLWDTAEGAVPTGWTPVSDSGGVYYQKFIRGAASYSAIPGGSGTHTHTISVSNFVGNNVPSGYRAGLSTSNKSTAPTHTHIVSATPGELNGSNLPSFRTLKLIKYSGGVPSSLPNKVIALFDAAPTSGIWTRYTAEDGYFLKGDQTAGLAGGNPKNQHSHTLTLTLNSTAGTVRSGTTAVVALTHGHSVLGTKTTNNATYQPPYREVLLYQNTSGGDLSIPEGLIGMFDGDPSSGWDSLSGSGGPFNNVFLKASSIYGGTGGGGTHTHDPLTGITSQGPTSTGKYSGRSSISASSRSTHTHTFNLNFSSISEAVMLPPYIDTVIAKYTGLGVTVSGNIYQESTSSPYEGAMKWSGCDGTTSNVSWALDGIDQANIVCSPSDGSFSFKAPLTSPNQLLTIWLDTNGQDKGVLYTLNNDTTSNISGLKVYKDRVWLESESSQSITNAIINTFDKTQDLDIPIASDGTNTQVDSGLELHINTGDTYAPGGDVTTPKLHIVGTYTGNSETLTLNGSGNSLTCDAAVANLRPLCIDSGAFMPTNNTTQFTGTSTSTIEATTYNNLQFDPASGTPTYTLLRGSLGGTGDIISYGSETQFQDYTPPPQVVALSTSKFVNIYDNDTDPDDGTSRIGEVSGATITFGGSEYRFHDGPPTIGESEASALNSNTFVVVYSASIAGYTKIGTVSGTTINYGSATQFATNASWLSVAALSETKFVVAYMDVDDLGKGKAKIGTVSGTTISFGPEVVFDGTGLASDCSVSKLDAGKFVVAWYDSGDSGHGKATIGTVSDSTVTFGSEYEFYAGFSDYPDVAALATDKFVVSWRDTPNTNKGKAVIGTITDTTVISYGSTAQFETDEIAESSVAALSETKFVVAYYGVNFGGRSIIGNISGTTVTFGSAATFNSQATNAVAHPDAVAKLESNKYVISYQGDLSYMYGFSIIGAVSDGEGTVTVNDFTTTGTGSLTVDVETYDPNLDINGNLTIGSGHTFSASSTGSLTLAGNFTNNGTFMANSGTVTFDDNSKTSQLLYSGATSFYGFDVSTAGKAIQFDETDQTNVINSLILQGTDCTTGRIFLDSAVNDDQWNINFTGSSVDIDYVDVEDSNALQGLTAEDSTQDNDNNSGWMINPGACL